MLRGSAHGWIGIDIGERAVKVAQLRREGRSWRLAATSACRRRQQGVDPSSALRDDLLSATILAEGLRTRPVAATLSMQSCRVEPYDEASPRDGDHCQDAWRGSDSTAYTMSAPRERVEKLVEAVSSLGRQCEAIDGPPLAIARALRLAPAAGAGVLLGGLDWGETNVTFVGAIEGRAAYARTLNVDGFSAVRSAVAERLALDDAEVESLLQKPIASPAERRLVSDALRDAIRPTVEELSRTLNHMGAKLRRDGVERLYLFGAGSVASGAAELVQRAASVRTEAFRVAELVRPTDSSTPPDSLIAQAIALSALAWEEAS